ncbi:DUF2812 domain-containing protein [Salibacterium aidingense]|uniref:DUF2812 domain-containing protein n=1 Tax=Salibacterium aidingense TaxID=384933 RepID=UPI000419FF24|nr:DUF2812 domain-containing protein [Salibacterium aidingense]
MRKFKCFIDYDKEEKWLREMANKGWQLENTSFGYKFRETTPEDTVIKIDYRTFKKQDDFMEYRTLFEDSGWEHMLGTKHSGTQYFKKKDNNSDNDIFSDQKSKAGKYKRLSNMFMEVAICYLPIFVAIQTTGVMDIEAFVDPKSLYYTEGLWDMHGVSFWKAFLFETPFALFRGFMWLFIPVALFLFLFFSYRANKLYEKNLN